MKEFYVIWQVILQGCEVISLEGEVYEFLARGMDPFINKDLYKHEQIHKYNCIYKHT